MENTKTLFISRSLLVALMILSLGGWMLQGCTNNTTNVNENGPGHGNGRIKVHMTDKPSHGNIQALTVDITKIEIHETASDSGGNRWQTISDSAQKVNILDLSDGKTTLLGSKDLQSGTYNQIRLILGSDNTVTADGNTMPIKIPSGQQTGIKINVNTKIQLQQGKTYNLLLDFNVAQSIHETGNGRYMMKPVIHAVDTQIDGYIKGIVQPDSTNAVIYAMNNQDTTSTFADTTNGKFKLMGIAPGTYSLKISPRNTSFSDTTLTTVSVNSNDTTDVGTITLPQK
ncbi:MAG TPA: DUF4382 domain-containing protein [Balneolales bacterium]|nr:DUF4382 domain-containing protein [Balneolales bacterium]